MSTIVNLIQNRTIQVDKRGQNAGYVKNKLNGNFSGFHRVALLSTVSRSNWNLEMLVFVEGGKPEYPEKKPRNRDENQQQTQPTYDAETGNQTRATFGGCECSDHSAIPAPLRSPQINRINSMSGGFFDPHFPCGYYIPPGPSGNMQLMQSFGSNVHEISSTSVPNSGSYITRNQPNPSASCSPPERTCSGSVSPPVSNSISTEDETKKPKQYDKWSQ